MTRKSKLQKTVKLQNELRSDNPLDVSKFYAQYDIKIFKTSTKTAFIFLLDFPKYCDFLAFDLVQNYLKHLLLI